VFTQGEVIIIIIIIIIIITTDHAHPAVFLIYFIPVTVVLLASLVLMVKFSLPCNNVGRAGVFYNFILVFSKLSCGLNILFIKRVVFKNAFNLLSMFTPCLKDKIGQILK